MVCIRQDNAYDRIALSEDFAGICLAPCCGFGQDSVCVCQDGVSVFGWENGNGWGPCQKARRCGKGTWEGFEVVGGVGIGVWLEWEKRLWVLMSMWLVHEHMGKHVEGLVWDMRDFWTSLSFQIKVWEFVRNEITQIGRIFFPCTLNLNGDLGGLESWCTKSSYATFPSELKHAKSLSFQIKVWEFLKSFKLGEYFSHAP